MGQQVHPAAANVAVAVVQLEAVAPWMIGSAVEASMPNDGNLKN
ncbi:hypothetical protein RKLH11_3474 [Rhodobacteraceae bacterium KLH11]|nr:hypothetical protein RKLH11_3474 [Rhodobacteraceae bacterium KLH11]